MEEKDAETFGDGSSSVASRALRRDGVMMAQCAHSDSDDDCENYYIGFLSEFDKESSSNGSVGDGSESRSRAVFGEDDDGPLPLDSLCRSWLDDACSSSAADGGGDGEMPAGGRVYPSQPIVSRVQLMQNADGNLPVRKFNRPLPTGDDLSVTSQITCYSLFTQYAQFGAYSTRVAAEVLVDKLQISILVTEKLRAHLSVEDLMHVMYCCSPKLPVFFLKTTQICSNWLQLLFQEEVIALTHEPLSQDARISWIVLLFHQMTSEDAACLVTTLDQWAGDGRTVTELTADQASDMLDKTTPPSSLPVDSSLYDFEEDMLPDDHHGDVSRDLEGHNTDNTPPDQADAVSLTKSSELPVTIVVLNKVNEGKTKKTKLKTKEICEVPKPKTKRQARRKTKTATSRLATDDDDAIGLQATTDDVTGRMTANGDATGCLAPDADNDLPTTSDRISWRLVHPLNGSRVAAATTTCSSAVNVTGVQVSNSLTLLADVATMQRRYNDKNDSGDVKVKVEVNYDDHNYTAAASRSGSAVNTAGLYVPMTQEQVLTRTALSMLHVELLNGDNPQLTAALTSPASKKASVSKSVVKRKQRTTATSDSKRTTTKQQQSNKPQQPNKKPRRVACADSHGIDVVKSNNKRTRSKPADDSVDRNNKKARRSKQPKAAATASDSKVTTKSVTTEQAAHKTRRLRARKQEGTQDGRSRKALRDKSCGPAVSSPTTAGDVTVDDATAGQSEAIETAGNAESSVQPTTIQDQVSSRTMPGNDDWDNGEACSSSKLLHEDGSNQKTVGGAQNSTHGSDNRMHNLFLFVEDSSDSDILSTLKRGHLQRQMPDAATLAMSSTSTVTPSFAGFINRPCSPSPIIPLIAPRSLPAPTSAASMTTSPTTNMSTSADGNSLATSESSKPVTRSSVGGIKSKPKSGKRTSRTKVKKTPASLKNVSVDRPMPTITDEDTQPVGEEKIKPNTRKKTPSLDPPKANGLPDIAFTQIPTSVIKTEKRSSDLPATTVDNNSQPATVGSLSQEDKVKLTSCKQTSHTKSSTSSTAAPAVLPTPVVKKEIPTCTVDDNDDTLPSLERLPVDEDKHLPTSSVALYYSNECTSSSTLPQATSTLSHTISKLKVRKTEKDILSKGQSAEKKGVVSKLRDKSKDSTSSPAGNTRATTGAARTTRATSSTTTTKLRQTNKVTSANKMSATDSKKLQQPQQVVIKKRVKRPQANRPLRNMRERQKHASSTKKISALSDWSEGRPTRRHKAPKRFTDFDLS